MTGIILVAGYGSRLGEETKNIPKCLLDISGKCSLGRMIENFRYSGIKNICIVTGFQSEKIKEYVDKEIGTSNNLFIDNPVWETTNNAYSLQLALENINDDIIVANGDVVCYKDLVKELVEFDKPNAMAVVRKKELVGEDMKVICNNNYHSNVLSVSKDIPTNNAYGEFTGIFKLEKDLVSYMVTELNENVRLNRNCWFEHALEKLCKYEEIAICDVSHFPFIEVDFPYDLDTARDIFPYDQPIWEIGQHHSIPIDQDDAFNLLRDVTDLLKRNGVESYLNWGTSLGIYRDNQFIPWDTDVDVSVFWKDRQKVISLIPELQKLRCFIPPVDKCYPEDFWIIRDLQKIELNFLEEINDRLVYSQNRCKLGTPRDIVLPFKKIEFRGYEFNIPNQIEKYLELSYGKNWKTPLKNIKPKSL